PDFAAVARPVGLRGGGEALRRVDSGDVRGYSIAPSLRLHWGTATRMSQEAAPQGDPAPTAADPPVAARVSSTRPIPRRLYRVDDFRNLDAWITDLSDRGVGLLVADPLAVGTLLFLELESTPDAPPVKVWATVTRCLPAEGGEWFAGCE